MQASDGVTADPDEDIRQGSVHLENNRDLIPPPVLKEGSLANQKIPGDESCLGYFLGECVTTVRTLSARAWMRDNT